MTATRKVYPSHPERSGNKAIKLGSDEWPRSTKEEEDIVKENFAEIFIFGTDGDPYTRLAEVVGCTRPRAKQLYYMALYRYKGLLLTQIKRDRVLRGRLVVRIKKYTDFLNNPETVYQILARAEDETDAKMEEDAAKKREARK